jgi:radical SAM superfamily enzyme YgiQ (UPF0313 family)
MNATAQSGPSILLAHSYYLRYDEKQWRRMKPYPPLATLLAASVLRNKGFAVHLFDAMLATGVEEFHRLVDALNPSIVGLVEDNFNFLTKMCTVRMREAAHSMIRYAKSSGCRVAVNGSDAADRPDLYLRAGADAVIMGEPENVLTDIVEAWSGDPEADVGAIPGVLTNTPERRTQDKRTGLHREPRRRPTAGLGSRGGRALPASLEGRARPPIVERRHLPGVPLSLQLVRETGIRYPVRPAKPRKCR